MSWLRVDMTDNKPWRHATYFALISWCNPNWVTTWRLILNMHRIDNWIQLTVVGSRTSSLAHHVSVRRNSTQSNSSQLSVGLRCVELLDVHWASIHRGHAKRWRHSVNHNGLLFVCVEKNQFWDAKTEWFHDEHCTRDRKNDSINIDLFAKLKAVSTTSV